MTGISPLPRSLDPLPDESLAGYLLRLSFRLGVPPGQAAALAGLIPGTGTIPASRMLVLDEATTLAFARAARLDPGEVTALTLAGLAGRYPPAGLSYLGRQRQPGGIFIKETWILSRFTRYCPQCLAGDPDSPVQQQLGGAWSRLWRLPVTFACPRHQRLLEHACPACGQPAHLRATHGGGLPSLIPLPAHAAVHPAACRHPHLTGSAARRDRLRPCGHLLSGARPVPWAEPPGGLSQALRTQEHLLRLLDPHGPAVTASGGEPATPAQYFTDLRILSCLITASWPAARDLAAPWQAALVSRHADAARRQASATAEGRAQHRQIIYYDTPPLEAAACAALLTLAANVLACTSPRSLSQAVWHLAGQAVPAFRRWARWFLAGDGYCSPALRAAVGPAVGARHVIKEATAAGNPSRLHPPPQPAALYSIVHVPAYLPAAWHAEHFAPLAGLAPEQLLRRAAAVCLARTCTAASYPRLGELLGIPPGSAKSTIKAVHRRLEAAGQETAFEAAVDALAAMLDTAAVRTDYGSRRHALRNWVISPGQWNWLTAGLPAHREAHADWGERKRMLASVWVWTRVTGGEHLFAPAVMADPAAPRSQQPGGRDRLTYIDLRWPHLATGTRGHYSELRQRLNDYADELAASIDSNHDELLS
ncbi:MAG: TniQ family protein [Streptosporangiaceae bacterium]